MNAPQVFRHRCWRRHGPAREGGRDEKVVPFKNEKHLNTTYDHEIAAEGSQPLSGYKTRVSQMLPSAFLCFVVDHRSPKSLLI